MADKTIVHESHGRAVDVDLSYTVAGNTVAYVQGWLVVATESGDSGETIAGRVDGEEYQWYVPDALSVSKGDVVYIEVADLTGHTPDDTAYSTSAGAGKVALFKATSAKVTANGSGNHYCIGKSLLQAQGV